MKRVQLTSPLQSPNIHNLGTSHRAKQTRLLHHAALHHQQQQQQQQGDALQHGDSSHVPGPLHPPPPPDEQQQQRMADSEMDFMPIALPATLASVQEAFPMQAAVAAAPAGPCGDPSMQQPQQEQQQEEEGGVEGRATEENNFLSQAWQPPVVPEALAQQLEVKWSKEMDELLREGVLRMGARWQLVVKHLLPHECNPEECEMRWSMIRDFAVKGPWSPEEDQLLRRLVEQFGSKKWSLIAQHFPGRSGKQCRERWLNHLDNRVKKSFWTEEEDRILCAAQWKLGNKWSEISKLLPGRAENAVKNRFNSIITKRLSHHGAGAGGAGGDGGDIFAKAYGHMGREAMAGTAGLDWKSIAEGRAGSRQGEGGSGVEGGANGDEAVAAAGVSPTAAAAAAAAAGEGGAVSMSTGEEEGEGGVKLGVVIPAAGGKPNLARQRTPRGTTPKGGRGRGKGGSPSGGKTGVRLERSDSVQQKQQHEGRTRGMGERKKEDLERQQQQQLAMLPPTKGALRSRKAMESGAGDGSTMAPMSTLGDRPKGRGRRSSGGSTIGGGSTTPTNAHGVEGAGGGGAMILQVGKEAKGSRGKASKKDHKPPPSSLGGVSSRKDAKEKEKGVGAASKTKTKTKTKTSKATKKNAKGETTTESLGGGDARFEAGRSAGDVGGRRSARTRRAGGMLGGMVQEDSGQQVGEFGSEHDYSSDEEGEDDDDEEEEEEEAGVDWDNGDSQQIIASIYKTVCRGEPTGEGGELQTARAGMGGRGGGGTLVMEGVAGATRARGRGGGGVTTRGGARGAAAAAAAAAGGGRRRRRGGVRTQGSKFGGLEVGLENLLAMPSPSLVEPSLQYGSGWGEWRSRNVMGGPAAATGTRVVPLPSDLLGNHQQLVEEEGEDEEEEGGPGKGGEKGGSNSSSNSSSSSSSHMGSMTGDGAAGAGGGGGTCRDMTDAETFVPGGGAAAAAAAAAAAKEASERGGVAGGGGGGIDAVWRGLSPALSEGVQLPRAELVKIHRNLVIGQGGEEEEIGRGREGDEEGPSMAPRRCQQTRFSRRQHRREEDEDDEESDTGSTTSVVSEGWSDEDGGGATGGGGKGLLKGQRYRLQEQHQLVVQQHERGRCENDAEAERVSLGWSRAIATHAEAETGIGGGSSRDSHLPAPLEISPVDVDLEQEYRLNHQRQQLVIQQQQQQQQLRRKRGLGSNGRSGSSGSLSSAGGNKQQQQQQQHRHTHAPQTPQGGLTPQGGSSTPLHLYGLSQELDGFAEGSGLMGSPEGGVDLSLSQSLHIGLSGLGSSGPKYGGVSDSPLTSKSGGYSGYSLQGLDTTTTTTTNSNNNLSPPPSFADRVSGGSGGPGSSSSSTGVGGGSGRLAPSGRGGGFHPLGTPSQQHSGGGGGGAKQRPRSRGGSGGGGGNSSTSLHLSIGSMSLDDDEWKFLAPDTNER